MRNKVEVALTFLVGLTALLLLTTAVLWAGDGADPSGTVITNTPSGDDFQEESSPGLEGFVRPDPVEPEAVSVLNDGRSALHVNVMPGKFVGSGQPYAWPGEVLTIWGNVHEGTPPFTYEWTFGDGSPAETGAVTDAKYIAVTHAYAAQGLKRAVLTVTDSDGDFDQDTVAIDVVAYSPKVEINLAIERGLAWLYRTQTSTGYWGSGNSVIFTTAQGVLCFENFGYLPTENPNRSIYAEYIQLALDNVLRSLAATNISNQTYCNPEEVVPGNDDANGLGVYANVYSNYRMYTIGPVMMAVIGSNAPYKTAPPDAAANIANRTYYDLVVDMVDFCAWAQTDNHSWYRGGWRYRPNYSSSDNSVSQWPAIGLDAAETEWGIEAPACTKTELERWINASRTSAGYFWYTNYHPYGALGVTGAGICEMAFADIPTADSRVLAAMLYIEPRLSSVFNFRYGMYSIAKGLRISRPEAVKFLPGGTNWYDVFVSNLLPRQSASGEWAAVGTNWGSTLDHQWAVLVLEPGVIPGPRACFDAPDSIKYSTPFALDGSCSYHTVPDSFEVVQWQWDFNTDDPAHDYDNPDAIGTMVQHPGFDLPPGDTVGYFAVGLRVWDNADPARQSSTTRLIKVYVGNSVPVCDPGGPYSGRVNEEIIFDGTGSYDADTLDGDSIVSFEWSYDGGANWNYCSNPVCTTSFNQPFEGAIGLRVTDTWGAMSECWTTIDISEIDLDLSASGISFDPQLGCEGDTVVINVNVQLDAEFDTTVTNVRVKLYDGDPEIAPIPIGTEQIIPSISYGQTVQVQVEWIVPDTLCHDIYVVIDPRGELSEWDELNNVSHQQWCCNFCGDDAIILPPEFKTYYANQIGPIVFEDSIVSYYGDTTWVFGPMTIDPNKAPIYIGNFAPEHQPQDLDLSTILINGTVVPETCFVAPFPHLFSVPVFEGQNVAHVWYSVRSFVQSFVDMYGWGELMDTTMVTYEVTGSFYDGTPFYVCQSVPMIGHRSGDVNRDNECNVLDLTIMIQYLFNGGAEPVPPEAGDVNHDGSLNVGDVGTLVGILFQ